MKTTTLAVVFSFVAVIAHAADDPAVIKGSNDTRIRTIDYNDKLGRVTRLQSTDLVPLVITYGEGETLTMIAGRSVVPITTKSDASAEDKSKASALCIQLGQTQAAWCADRHSNELTLTPMHTDDGSLLVVTTAKTNAQGILIHHHYNYELSTREGKITDVLGVNGKPDPDRSTDRSAYFSIQYTYSAEEAADKANAWRSQHVNDVSNAARQKVADRLALSSKVDPKSFANWQVDDSVDCQTLKPHWTGDNGRETIMHFDMNTPVSLPSYPGLTPKDESSANYTPNIAPDSGLEWRFPIVPKTIYLRRENLVCGIHNEAFNPKASAVYTGTVSADVVRGEK